MLISVASGCCPLTNCLTSLRPDLQDVGEHNLVSLTQVAYYHFVLYSKEVFIPYMQEEGPFLANQASITQEHINIRCGMIIEKDEKILLQRNPGENHWSLPGGMLQIGERYENAAIRGVLEETALTVENPKFFGMLSGRDCFVTNKFGAKAFILQVVFWTTEFTGKVKIIDESNREHRFYKRTTLPKNLNPQQRKFIYDWKEKKPFPIIN